MANPLQTMQGAPDLLRPLAVHTQRVDFRGGIAPTPQWEPGFYFFHLDRRWQALKWCLLPYWAPSGDLFTQRREAELVARAVWAPWTAVSPRRFFADGSLRAFLRLPGGALTPELKVESGPAEAVRQYEKAWASIDNFWTTTVAA